MKSTKSAHSMLIFFVFVFLLSGAVWAQCRLDALEIVDSPARPLGIVPARDQTPRLFILEQYTGRIQILDTHTNTILATPFLDIDGLDTGSEQGLLGLAFHPDYENNGTFFVNCTVPGGFANNGITQIRRYQVSADPNIADSNFTVILSYEQPFSNHNAGWMDFGPDGYLYIASGDGGGSPGNRAQDLSNLLGKMLRIDVDAADGPTGEYGIPVDNPFVGTAGASEEIWSYGLRNPWRCSFDIETGDLWIADVGNTQWEEINFQPASSSGGENYGWPVMEGTQCFDNSVSGAPPCFDSSFTEPIYEYSHSVGISITGGYVYRGDKLGTMQGRYFFADYGTARVWSLRYDGQQAVDVQEHTDHLDIGTDFDLISSFGQDPAGELYIADISDGEIYALGTAGTQAGDLNGDCFVGLEDLAVLGIHWLSGLQ